MAFKEIIKKINGKQYIYLDESYWDKEKKGSRHRSKLIGKIDENGEKVYRLEYLKETGKIVPVSKTIILGDRKIADKIIENSGIKKVLAEENNFSENEIDKILALATYQMIEGELMSNAEKWIDDRGYDLFLSSSKIRELLENIDSNRINTFFKNWIKFNKSKSDIVYNISPVLTSNKTKCKSTSECNIEDEKIHFNLLTTSKDFIPLMYKVLPERQNDTDLIESIDECNSTDYTVIDNNKVCNVNNLESIKANYIFPIACDTDWVKEEIFKVFPSIEIDGDIIKDEEDSSSLVYGTTSFMQNEEYGDFYLHIYYDLTRKAEESLKFNNNLDRVQRLYENGNKIESDSDKTFLKTYFDLRENNGKKVAIMKREEVKNYRQKLSCCYALITTSKLTSSQALVSYRKRVQFENYFENLKNATDCKNFRMDKKENLYGKLFIVFISLILVNQLKKDIKKIPISKIGDMSWKQIIRKGSIYSVTLYTESGKEIYSLISDTLKNIFEAFSIEYKQG